MKKKITLKIDESDLKKRLDVFVVQNFQNLYTRSAIVDCIEKGIVLVNASKQKASYKLKLNDVVSFDEEELNSCLNPDLSLKPYQFKLDILYEDDDILVINKPKGMLTHPTKYEREKTLCNALIYHCSGKLSDISGVDRLGIVHRLDKNTSGLILAAKNNSSHENLALQIRQKSAKRKYLAIALGEFKTMEGIIDKPLVHYLKDDVKMEIAKDNKGLEAITFYKVKEQYKGAALIELELKTGRTHQIRAHLSSINHPIFGDNLYGAKGFMKNEFCSLKTKEQLLQSYYISFTHPKTGKNMQFELEESQFSEDFIKVLNFLRRKNEY